MLFSKMCVSYWFFPPGSVNSAVIVITSITVICVIFHTFKLWEFFVMQHTLLLLTHNNRFLRVDIVSSLKLVLYQVWLIDGTPHPCLPVKIMEEPLGAVPLQNLCALMVRLPHHPPFGSDTLWQDSPITPTHRKNLYDGKFLSGIPLPIFFQD